MPVIQIWMPKPNPAESIIRLMVKVLKQRYEQRVSRRAFLARWGQLRRHLSATAEYQAFREAVIERDHGKCVECGTPSRTVHHKRPVAKAPHLALKLSNGQVVCDDCHVKHHAHMRAA